MTSATPVATLLVDVRPVDHPTARDRGIGRYTAGLLSGLCSIGAPVIGLYGSDAEAERARAAAPSLPLCRWGPEVIREHLDPATWYLATQLLLHPVSLDPVPSVVSAAGLPVAAVMYDVIPYRHPAEYQREASARALASTRAPLARSVDAMLAISQFSLDTAAEELGYPADRMRMIGAGVDAQFVPPSVRRLSWPSRVLPDDVGPFVVAVTGGDRRKNTDGLIRAWALVGDDVRRATTLVVATAAPAAVIDGWRRVAADEGVADRVVFTGRVTDDEMVALLQRARLAVVPSFEEGFGLPVLEAAACGCPAICSDTTSLPEVLAEPAAWFDPHDPSAIARAIERGVADDRRREVLVAAGQRSVERFTWERVAADTMAALAELGPRWPADVRPPAIRLALAGPTASSAGPRPGAAPADRWSADEVVAAIRRAASAPRVDLFVDRSGVADPTAADPERYPVRALGRYRKPWDYDHLVVVLDGGEPTGRAPVAPDGLPCHVWLNRPAAVPAHARSVIVANDEAATAVQRDRPDHPPILVLDGGEPSGASAIDDVAGAIVEWLADVDHLAAGTIRRLRASAS